ncbi:gastrotropin-like [Watersipora subatra]|uniref:gastrotropin-like n=1 Tax=Watersipora subatra TaxID=2589382 RepID=UPI00355B5AD5
MSAAANAIVGKWKLESNENTPAFMVAMGMNEEMMTMLKDTKMEYEYSVNGDEITHVVQLDVGGGRTITHTFKIGEEFSEQAVGSFVTKVKYSEEGGKLIRTAVSDKASCRVTIEVKDGKLVETGVCDSSPPVTSVRTFVKA